MIESLVIEITRSVPDEWRVVERTHRTTESAYRVNYSPKDLAGLLKEITVRLGSIDSVDDGDNLRLNRLGARLAEMCLPAPLGEKLAAHSGSVEFFLDNESVILPVELFPNQGGVLAAYAPVTRHWFCESTLLPRPTPGRKKRQALIVADPARNLPAARKEGTAVRRFFGRRKEWQCRYLARAVTVAEFSRELPETDLLHLAAHYEAGESGEQAGIVMTDGRWLPSGTSPAPDLVFANCCRAGLPADVGGDLSLAGHFLKYGARHVIAPFLPVPDEIALKFATAFYSALDRSADVANAALSARKALGAAGWMYWHFGPTLNETVQTVSPSVQKKSGNFGKLIFILALIFAAAVPWLKPVDRNPIPSREIPAVTHEPSSVVPHFGEPITESIELILPVPDPVESNEAEQKPRIAIDESLASAVDTEVPSVIEEALPETESATVIEPDAAPPPPSSPIDSDERITTKTSVVNPDPPEAQITGEDVPVVVSPDEAPESSTGGDSSSDILDITPVAEPAPVKPEVDIDDVVLEQMPPATTKRPVASKKPGLFDESLAEVERQQSFEDAAIQVLAGYPEKYLKAAVKGKPDYNAATGKASVIVEVTIDNEMYRTMALRLSETLKQFSHAGEQISATMQRPYDSYLEVRYQFSGRKQFRDLLLLCLRANDALTRSEWEFYSLPRNSIDAILSSMNMPLLSVVFTDHSGQIVASASHKIPKPFSTTDARCFKFFPVFDDGSADLAATSLIPGRNRLKVKMEFDLSLEEIRKVADVLCTIEKGNSLPKEFRYRFLQ